MTNPYPESNTPEEKLAEANAFSQGYYSPGVFEWWTEHPYRAWTLRHIMPYLDLYDSIKVLEPACGCGVNLANLHSRFPNCECTGVELSPQGVEVARECAPGDYRCGDAENLRWPMSHKTWYCALPLSIISATRAGSCLSACGC